MDLQLNVEDLSSTLVDRSGSSKEGNVSQSVYGASHEVNQLLVLAGNCGIFHSFGAIL